jgi:hypothetical protein
VHVDGGKLALELLPTPQPDEVVAVRREEVEVGGKSNRSGSSAQWGPKPRPSWRLLFTCDPVR